MHIEGYLDIIILFGLTISGAIQGVKLKQYNIEGKLFNYFLAKSREKYLYGLSKKSNNF